MNCLEFRRHCLADPASQEAEFIAHRRNCQRCAEFAADVAQLDRKIAEALQVDVPDHLSSRIVLRQSLYRDQQHQKRRRLYALAASVIVAIGLTVALVLTNRGPSLDQRVLAHIDLERELLSTREAVTHAKLVRVLKSAGAELVGDLGDVQHASLCPLSEHGGAHLVFDGRKGPVIVLLLPKEFVAAPTAIHIKEMGGLVLPTGNGSMALVSEHDESLQEIAQRMRSAVTWRL
ncbi:MAG: DUF3379 family protein [Acidiferrobacterales bacterium]|nr:DUF3379 family protein [Acidiferrobacterales bacterium]